ncbi:MAG: hypothetical protein A3C36_03870 [Omnitrophica WOR_2 bacterium RIFCSPHIGHO2_02_FULL_52_10]|nr:MAG: hypothetical protein A3C36_03870 [Omnitrophica WOR_2 bacterium RIFCSPHIGHO2_02_FULL_52_10]
MDLRDLNKINIEDLKEIDWNLAKAHLVRRPDLLFNTAMIFITLIFGIWAYQTNAQKIRSLKSDLGNLEQRYTALQDFEAVRKKHAEFVKGAPEIISDNRLIEILAEIALKRNVQITSFSPSQQQANDYVRLTKVQINIQSQNYADIIWFMYDIENSPYSIRIGEWSGTQSDAQKHGFLMRGTRQDFDNEDDAEYIEVTVDIESVGFKNV